MECSYTTLPEAFLAKIDKLFEGDLKQQVLESYCAEKPKTFRTNTLKITSEELEKSLQKQGISLEKVVWYPDAFILRSDPQQLMSTKEYKEGQFYIQGLSSMIPALVLAPQSHEKILDIAAAPGSKTTQIAACMQNIGEIVANDISRARLFRLKDSLQTQGIINTKVFNFPGEKIWQKYPEYFDKALVDVPCSMEGRFEAWDSKTFEDWTPGKVRHLVLKQCFLLRSAISSTKVGGTIVYSTCTLSPEENEGVIDWIVKKEEGNIELETINSFPFSHLLSPGITRWGEKKYTVEVAKTARIIPNDLMEGFFVAKIRKLKSNF